MILETPIRATTLDALCKAMSGDKVLLIFKSDTEMDNQIMLACEELELLSMDYWLEREKAMITVNGGILRCMTLNSSKFHARGIRSLVVFDESIEDDLNAINALKMCEYGYRGANHER